MPVEPEGTIAIGLGERLDHLRLAPTHLPLEILEPLAHLTLGPALV
jgi:hypothetical protein